MPKNLLAVLLVSPAIAACQLWATPADGHGGQRAVEEELALGKHVYDTHCARCHGADGKAEGYPFILTLDGIGRRYTLEQILEETWATGFVAPQQFTPAEQQAMAKYVATL